jgi:hypothetical protein
MAHHKWLGAVAALTLGLITACAPVSAPPGATAITSELPTSGPTATATAMPTLSATACDIASLKPKLFPAGEYDVPAATTPRRYASEALELINTAPTGCYLRGPSRMTLASASGVQRPVEITGVLSAGGQLIPPAMAVMLDVGSPLACAKPTRAEVMSSLKVTFPRTGDFDIRGLNLRIQCIPPAVLVFQATYLAPPSAPSR